jgi:hypothetical protein
MSDTVASAATEITIAALRHPAEDSVRDPTRDRKIREPVAPPADRMPVTRTWRLKNQRVPMRCRGRPRRHRAAVELSGGQLSGHALKLPNFGVQVHHRARDRRAWRMESSGVSSADLR